MTIAVFILYLLMMLGIGFYFSKKANSLNSYYLGDRGMNKWVVAMSAQASDMSGWLLMGLPGAIFVSGLSEVWIAVGLGIGTYLNWKIVGRDFENTLISVMTPSLFLISFQIVSVILVVSFG